MTRSSPRIGFMLYVRLVGVTPIEQYAHGGPGNNDPDGNSNRDLDGNFNRDPDGNSDRDPDGNSNCDLDGNSNRYTDGNSNCDPDGNSRIGFILYLCDLWELAPEESAEDSSTVQELVTRPSHSVQTTRKGDLYRL